MRLGKKKENEKGRLQQIKKTKIGRKRSKPGAPGGRGGVRLFPPLLSSGGGGKSELPRNQADKGGR